MTKSKKNLLIGVLSLAMIAGAGVATATIERNSSLPTTITANATTEGVDFTYDADTKTMTVKTNDYVTLSEYQSLIENVEFTSNVTSIADSAFYDCTKIKSITIPDTITSINSQAFYNCEGLESITLPNSLVSIGGYAFYGCSQLKSVTIPNSITSIPSSLFCNCEGLESVTIPNSVTSIAAHAFDYCTSLTSIALPDAVKTLSDYIFSNCLALTSVTFANDITSIGDAAFMSTAITSITIPATVTKVGSKAFSGCRSLTSVQFRGTPSNLGSYLFQNMNTPLSPAKLTLPCDWTKTKPTASNDAWNEGYFTVDWDFSASRDGSLIATLSIDGKTLAFTGSGVMRGLTSAMLLPWYGKANEITSVMIADGITSVGAYVLSGTSITSMILPASVSYVGERAFQNCKSLADIEFKGVANVDTSAFSGINDSTKPAKMMLPGNWTGDSPTYSSQPWKSGYFTVSWRVGLTVSDNVIAALSGNGQTLTFSGTGAMINPGHYNALPWQNKRASITSVVIGDGITNVGEGAFYGCSSMTNVTIGKDVTTIGKLAFVYCYKLASVTIPTGVTSIGNNAFQSCSKLASVTIPNTVTSLGESAFSYCSELTSVTIPDSVTSIGKNAFQSCPKLASITIPNSVTSLGDGAFDSCVALTSATIGTGISGLGEKTFYKCGELTSITIPDNITSIGNGAFEECAKLTSITIPSSVTSLGTTAFASCSALTQVEIKNKDTSVATDTFNSVGTQTAPVKLVLPTGWAGTAHDSSATWYGGWFSTHDHTWEYTANNNTITATCTPASGTCPDSTVLTLTLSANSDLTYDNTAKTASHDDDTVKFAEATKATIGNIEYYQGNTKLTNGAPTAVGTYTAKVTVTIGQNTYTLSNQFAITKASQSDITVSVSGYTYDGTVSTPSTNGAIAENASVTYYYNTTNSNQNGTAWTSLTATTLDVGTYYVYAVVGSTTNYDEFATEAVSFTISNGTLGEVTANGYLQAYDGQAHGASISCTTNGVTVKYGTTEGTYDLTTSPTVKDVANGPLTVYYEVSKANYESKTGSVTLTVEKATPTAKHFTCTLPKSLAYKADEGKAATVTVAHGYEGMGEITISYALVDHADIIMLEDGALPTEVGTYIVYITVAEGENFTAMTQALEVKEFAIVKASNGIVCLIGKITAIFVGIFAWLAWIYYWL